LRREALGWETLRWSAGSVGVAEAAAIEITTGSGACISVGKAAAIEVAATTNRRVAANGRAWLLDGGADICKWIFARVAGVGVIAHTQE
jgi:hypothetical protein